jgi:hypothetical protein
MPLTFISGCAAGWRELTDWVSHCAADRAVPFEFTLTLIGQFLVSRCAADRAVPPDGGN